MAAERGPCTLVELACPTTAWEAETKTPAATRLPRALFDPRRPLLLVQFGLGRLGRRCGFGLGCRLRLTTRGGASSFGQSPVLLQEFEEPVRIAAALLRQVQVAQRLLLVA